MPRNRRTAKDNGTRMETAVRDYLAWALNDQRIVRPRLRGANDTGDIANVSYHGQPVCIECKWLANPVYGSIMAEAEREAGNCDSPYPWGVAKRDRVGIKTRESVGKQWAFTRLNTLTLMLEPLPKETRITICERMTLRGRASDIAMLTVRQFALLLNSGLPLGGENDE